MAKLTEYPRALKFDANDILVKDGVNGTHKITIEDVVKELGVKLADETLSESGMLAPADKVGEEIERLDKKTSVIEDKFDDIVALEDGVDGERIRTLIVEINPMQRITEAAPSPDNICPIAGHTGVTIRRTGFNMLGGDRFLDDLLAVTPGASYDREQRRVFLGNGPSYAPNGRIAGIHHSNGKYYGVRLNGDVFTLYVHTLRSLEADTRSNLRYTGKSPIDSQSPIRTKRVGESGIYMRTYMSSLYNARLSGTTRIQIDDVCLLKGSVSLSDIGVDPNTYLITDPDKFPRYKGDELSIDWESVAGTVYGGKLNVLTGELTVTHECYESYAGESLPGAWISSMDVYSPGAVPTTGATVVYELASPKKYLVQPKNLTTFEGANRIWANTGKISVGVHVDMKGYVDEGDAASRSYADQVVNEALQNIAVSPDTEIAERSYSVGEFVTFNSILYKVVSPIAVEETFQPGINITKTTVGEELTAIWAAINP